MKTLKLKRLWLIFVAITLSCGDDDQIALLNNSTNEISAAIDDGGIAYNRWDDSGTVAPRYDGSDGGPIDNTVASTWIRNFEQHARMAAPATHYFTRQTIENILAQGGCTGLRIYYAINGNNELKLIICGVDKNGNNILAEKPVLAVTQENISGNPAGTIDYTSARAWIDSYQNTMAPTEIKSHYFGRIGIEAVFAQEGCAGLHIYHAINDNDEKKLLVVGTAENSENVHGRARGGRTKENDLPIMINFSFPCPSTCSNGGNGGL